MKSTLIAIGLLVSWLSPLALADDLPAMKMCHRSCIKLCEQSRDASFDYRNGHYPDPKLVDSASDCIALCKATSELAARKSPYAQRLAAVCADVCSRCADACQAAQKPELSECISDCKMCAEVCRKFSTETTDQSKTPPAPDSK